MAFKKDEYVAPVPVEELDKIADGVAVDIDGLRMLGVMEPPALG